MELFLFFLITLIMIYLLKQYFNGPKNTKKNMNGKLLIITGASDGISLESTKDYYQKMQR